MQSNSTAVLQKRKSKSITQPKSGNNKALSTTSTSPTSPPTGNQRLHAFDPIAFERDHVPENKNEIREQLKALTDNEVKELIKKVPNSEKRYLKAMQITVAIGFGLNCTIGILSRLMSPIGVGGAGLIISTPLLAGLTGGGFIIALGIAYLVHKFYVKESIKQTGLQIKQLEDRDNETIERIDSLKNDMIKSFDALLELKKTLETERDSKNADSANKLKILRKKYDAYIHFLVSDPDHPHLNKIQQKDRRKIIEGNTCYRREQLNQMIENAYNYKHTTSWENYLLTKETTINKVFTNQISQPMKAFHKLFILKQTIEKLKKQPANNNALTIRELTKELHTKICELTKNPNYSYRENEKLDKLILNNGQRSKNFYFSNDWKHKLEPENKHNILSYRGLNLAPKPKMLHLKELPNQATLKLKKLQQTEEYETSLRIQKTYQMLNDIFLKEQGMKTDSYFEKNREAIIKSFPGFSLVSPRMPIQPHSVFLPTVSGFFSFYGLSLTALSIINMFTASLVILIPPLIVIVGVGILGSMAVYYAVKKTNLQSATRNAMLDDKKKYLCYLNQTKKNLSERNQHETKWLSKYREKDNDKLRSTNKALKAKIQELEAKQQTFPIFQQTIMPESPVATTNLLLPPGQQGLFNPPVAQARASLQLDSKKYTSSFTQ